MAIDSSPAMPPVPSLRADAMFDTPASPAKPCGLVAICDKAVSGLGGPPDPPGVAPKAEEPRPRGLEEDAGERSGALAFGSSTRSIFHSQRMFSRMSPSQHSPSSF